MTLQPENKSQLIKYRIEKAWDIYQEAEILFNANKKLGTVNRLYYSLFNMVLALLLLNGIKVKTHKGVYLKFNQYFIKTEIFPVEYSKLFNHLLSLRQNADYENFQLIEFDEIAILKQQTKQALKTIENYINQNLQNEPLASDAGNKAPSA